MGYDTDGYVRFGPFKGLRNDVAPDAMGLDDLAEANNVHLNNAGELVSRDPIGEVLIAGDAHSLYASSLICVVVQGTSLLRVNANYSASVLRTGLAQGRPVSYWPLGAKLYWSNGVDTGVIENGVDRSWGLAVPGLPAAVAVAGTMPVGAYQFVLTYLRNDGQESGASVAGKIVVPDRGGIHFTSIPVSSDPTVTQKCLYVTMRDGTVLYAAAVLANAVATHTVNAEPNINLECHTQFLQPPPAGDIVAVAPGHALVAVGNVLHVSEPYSFELFDRRKAQQFEQRITIVAPVADGVYLATTETTAWLRGAVSEAEFIEKASYGGVPGTLAYTPRSAVGQGGDGNIAMWMSTRGVVAGTDAGELRNMTEERFSFPSAISGAAVVRQTSGINQYIGVSIGQAAAANKYQE